MPQNYLFVRKLALVLSVLFAVAVHAVAQSDGCFMSARAAGDMNLLTYSGNRELDAANQHEGMELIKKFGVTPRGFFFDDGNAPNAFASGKVTNQLGPDGTVAFGLNLLNKELQRDGGSGLAVPAIMAHEFAHIVQFKRNSTLSVRDKELQADYLAGWYLGSRWIPTDSSAAFKAFFEMGDYQFNNPDHHGTPAQRLKAIQAGVRDTGLSLDNAYKTGATLARSL